MNNCITILSKIAPLIETLNQTRVILYFAFRCQGVVILKIYILILTCLAQRPTFIMTLTTTIKSKVIESTFQLKDSIDSNQIKLNLQFEFLSINSNQSQSQSQSHPK